MKRWSRMIFEWRTRIRKMRSKNRKKKKIVRVKTTVKPGCVVCKKTCVDDKQAPVVCRLNPDLTGCLTRSMTRWLEVTRNFVIVETYRCMPLLGDEQENAPDWDIHIVNYTIIFESVLMKPTVNYSEFYH